MARALRGFDAVSPDDDKLVIVFEGGEYPVSSRTFAYVATDFFWTFQGMRDAQARRDRPAQIGALLWLHWGIMGLIRHENPEIPDFDLTLRQVEGLGDALYYAAVERGYKPN